MTLHLSSQIRVDETLVSVVVTTRNEEANIASCLWSVRCQSYSPIQLIVVDNFSTDRTREIAESFGAEFHQIGPERSAQRNFGLLQCARGKYAIYIDADMILSPELVASCVAQLSILGVGALYIDEYVVGDSILAAIRRFERKFYTGTTIDAVRFFERKIFLESGGFDEGLLPGPEDWDLDRRIRQYCDVAVLPNSGMISNWEMSSFMGSLGVSQWQEFIGLYHNEHQQTLGRYLSKKSYYIPSMAQYVAKWGLDDKTVREQLGIWNRYIVVFFTCGKWKEVLKRPHLFIAMMSLRVCVGLIYFLKKMRG